jgi:outer membrane protein assembly factor BamB
VYSVASLPPFGECGGANFPPATQVESATRLYMFDDRCVKAFDLATGAPVWSSRQLATGTGGTVRQLALSGNRLFVGQLCTCLSESDPGGAVVALNASTGAQLWDTQVLSPVTALVVSGTKLVVGQAGSGAGPALQVLDTASGNEIWSNDCDAPNAFVVAGTIVTAS